MKRRRASPHPHLPGIDSRNRPRAARLKEAGEMEFVLIILVVTLLIILPLLFFVVMIGGLGDAVRRSIRGSQRK